MRLHGFKRRQRQHGLAMVEFTLVLPVLLLLFFGALECCNMAFLNQTLSVASYEGARHAIQYNSTNESSLFTGVSIFTRLSTMPSRRSRWRQAFCMRG